MPAYDYRCLTCDEQFERRVPAEMADDVLCSQGHDQVKRLLSVFAVGRATSSLGAPAPAAMPTGGGCCGGGCGCG